MSGFDPSNFFRNARAGQAAEMAAAATEGGI